MCELFCRKHHDYAKVCTGSILICFTARCLRITLACHVPFTLENPRNSRLWLCPPIRHVCRRRDVRIRHTEFCMFGTPWRKSTTFAAAFVSLDMLQAYRCLGARRGMCRNSGLPHPPLAGVAPNGRFYTAIAEPYPRPLCRILASAFRNYEVQQLAADFSVCIGMPAPAARCR